MDSAMDGTVEGPDENGAGLWAAWIRFAHKHRRLALGLAGAAAATAAVRAAWIYLVPNRVASCGAQAAVLKTDFTGPGTLDALLSATLGAKVNTRVLDLHADVGDRVKAGQLLMVLDQEELKAQEAEATASRIAAHQQVLGASESLRRLDLVHAKAARDLEREESLFRKQVLSVSDLDGYKTAADTSERDLRQAQAALDQAKSLETQAEESLREVRSRLADSRILAPFDGLVTQRMKSPGDILTPGTPVMSLVNLPSVIVVARFDETLLGHVQLGAPAQVEFYHSPGVLLPGRVTRINRSVDPDTREFTVNISLDQLPGAWAMGERAKVTLPGQRVPASYTIPLGYLATRHGQQGVWTESGNRAHFVPVSTGVRDGARIELTADLPRNARILAPQGLRIGMKVQTFEDGHEPRD